MKLLVVFVVCFNGTTLYLGCNKEQKGKLHTIAIIFVSPFLVCCKLGNLLKHKYSKYLPKGRTLPFSW